MIVNMTPHGVTVLAMDGQVLRVLPPSGQVVRVSTTEAPYGEVDGLPVCLTVFGGVVGLPEPIKGTTYLVSLVVRQACPDRTDLVSPGQLVRGPDGQPIGCRGLSR